MIKVHLGKFNFQINYLPILINSFQGKGFMGVETATVSFICNG
jgi:stress response protein SCP2